jgi:N-hydroxyarylamine O-acetyltransferase
MLLRVDLTDDAAGPWLVDAGFGGHLINVPLPLRPDRVRASGAGHLRLTREADVFTLETQLPHGWSRLYRFTLEAHSPADYEPLNWFTATHPASIFRHNLLVERLTPATRASLLNDRLTLRMPGQAPAVRRIASVTEFAQVLDSVFDLDPPVSAADLFARLPQGLDGMFGAPPD